MKNFLTLNSDFWRKNPALLYGITLLIGSSSALFWPFPWNFFFPLFWSLYLLLQKREKLCILLAAAALYSQMLYQPILEPREEKALYFSTHSVQPYQSPFKKGFLYKGLLYLPEGAIPCSIYSYGKKFPADSDYILSGKLTPRNPYDLIFKPKKWTPVKKSFSLAELRFKAKKNFLSFLEKKIPSKKAASFLSSLVTGNVESRSLQYEFTRLGLQHILAISGFHFGVLIALFSFFLNFVFPRRWIPFLLLIAINAYFIFIGSLPSVQRSWAAANLYLFSRILSKNTSGLNLLGAALILEILSDPLVSSKIGFQLSFASCFGILLLYPLFNKILFSKRSASDFLDLGFFSKHASFLLLFLQKAICLTLAVNTAIFPLLLYHFHQFPWLSLFYNLFFPFLAGAAIFFLLISLIIHLIVPPFASFLFKATSIFTSEILNLAAYPPSALDYSFYAANIPAWTLPLYLFCLLLAVLIRPSYQHFFRL